MFLFGLLFIVSVSGRYFIQMTSNKMSELRRDKNNYLFHFIVVNEEYLEPIQELFSKAFIPNVVFYYNDCNQNNLPECQNKHDYPALIIYNKVFLHYPDQAESPKDIFTWLNTTVFRKPLSKFQKKQQVEKLLQEKSQLFIMYNTHGLESERYAFATLCKQFYLSTFVYVLKEKLSQELNISAGSLYQMNGNIQNLTKLKKLQKYEDMQQFVKQRFISFLPRINNLSPLRFMNKTFHLETFVLICDFSSKCNKVWSSLFKIHPDLKQKGIKVMKMIYGEENSDFQIAYHVRINKRQLPLLLYLSHNNTNQSIGVPQRYFKHLDSGTLSIKDIQSFEENIKNNKLQKYILTASNVTQKKKKGAEKYIKKLTFDSYYYEINKASTHFLVIVLNSKKQASLKLYEQYKKTITFLQSEGFQIVYGMIDVAFNQIDIPSIRSIPSIFLYPQFKRQDPILIGNSSFHLLSRKIKEKLNSFDKNYPSEDL